MPCPQSQTEVAVYKGPITPVTCLAVGGKGCKTIFAGSWDKSIWSWDIQSTQPGRKYQGHSDFVKAVTCATLSGINILISGGADKKIMVWNIETGARIHTIQDPLTLMMAVQHLAVDPVLTSPDSVVLVSASSDPHIRRWRIALDSYEQLAEEHHDKPGAERPTILEHETSVYKVVFDRRADDDEADADLLTASADGTAQTLSRARKFEVEDVFEHGDYVRAVAATDLWVITAGRDEHVKVWDRSSGELYCALEGHYDEVTDLVVLRGSAAGGRRGGDLVCSVSIDGTIRTWPLEKAELDRVVREIREAGKPKAEDEEAKTQGDDMLTAEEAAELEALLEDD